MSKYRTSPLVTDKMPPGIPYIIGNEAAERFSFYGMKSILQVHLTALFVIAGIGDELASEKHAQEMVHLLSLIHISEPTRPY